MKISDLSRYGFLWGLVLGAALMLCLTLLVRKTPAGAPQKPVLFAKEGFDFSGISSKNNEWRGPEIGEKINLTHLKAKDGSSLAEVISQRPAMLVALNPECGMCTLAADEMRYIRDQIASTGLGYYPVSFIPDDGSFDLDAYSRSLGLGPVAFQWSADAPSSQDSIVNMTSPSHLLVNPDGIVIKVWPGSYGEKSVRDRMGKQIVADALIINDTLNVSGRKAALNAR
jgi:hypothetical protein